MDIVTLDFETYFDKEYSLKKMTTEAYVMDARFQVLGVARKINDAPAEWLFGDQEVGKFLREVDYSKCAVLCHNATFDGAILNWRYDIRPKLWLDTLSMARPFHGNTIGVSLKALADHYGLPNKGDYLNNMLGKRLDDLSFEELSAYAGYGTNDAEITYQLFNKLRGKLPKSEYVTIDQTIRMFTEPQLELDFGALSNHWEDLKEKKWDLLTRVGSVIQYKDGEMAMAMINSADKLAAALRTLGVEPPTKTSPKTGKESYAFAKTDQEFLRLQDHPDYSVQALVAARLGLRSTIEESRTKSLMEIAVRTREGRLPVMLHYYGAHTGRYSGGDKINLQNLPRGGNLRRSIKAPAGKTIITCDLSQIEARLLAYVAGQADLVQAFAEARDVYSEFATDVYGRLITKADKVERFVGKTCTLGLGYMVGPTKLRKTLAIGSGGITVDVSDHEAQRMVNIYRTKNYKIKEFWRRCDDVLGYMVAGREGDITDTVPLFYRGNSLILPNGMPAVYPELSRVKGEYQYLKRRKPEKLYGGKLTENIIQALAAVTIKGHMMQIRKRYPVALQVHDEIVIVVPQEEEAEAKAFVAEIMSTPPAWAPGLPIACEVGSGPNYGEAK